MEIKPPISEKHESNSALYKATGQLIVSNVQKTKDIGVYKCFVEDNSSNRNSAVWRVQKIIGKYRTKTRFSKCTKFYQDFKFSPFRSP